MCVQVGSYRPHVFEDFFLLWDGQQFPLFPEFPDVKPQEVQPFFDVHDPGFGFTECQPSFLEKLSLFVVWHRFPILPVSGPLSQNLG